MDKYLSKCWAALSLHVRRVILPELHLDREGNMRILCAAAATVAVLSGSSASYACTAGGVPCDQVYGDQLRTIDRHRTDNIQRQEQIEIEQHRNNLARIKREQELQAARSAQNPAPTTTITNQVPNAGRPSTNAQMPAECRAYPSMCSAYK